MPKNAEQYHCNCGKMLLGFLLYGFLNVTKKFSTGEWLNHCQKKIKEIQSRNKIPILVGGTGLYFKALTEYDSGNNKGNGKHSRIK